jgi:solute carrier family 45 protein 1/2/4
MSREIDPLLKESMSPLDDDDWQGEQQTEETMSSWYLFLLTFGGLGLQIGWSVETSNGSVRFPFFSVSVRARGPCIYCFLTLDPVIYEHQHNEHIAISSRSCHPVLIHYVALPPLPRSQQVHAGPCLDRRTIISLMALAWAKEIVGNSLGIFGANPESTGVKTCVMLFAVSFVYVLDFAINVRKYLADIPSCLVHTDTK